MDKISIIFIIRTNLNFFNRDSFHFNFNFASFYLGFNNLLNFYNCSNKYCLIIANFLNKNFNYADDHFHIGAY